MLFVIEYKKRGTKTKKHPKPLDVYGKIAISKQVKFYLLVGKKLPALL